MQSAFRAEKVLFITAERFDALEIITYSLVNGVHGGTVRLPVAAACGPALECSPSTPLNRGVFVKVGGMKLSKLGALQ